MNRKNPWHKVLDGEPFRPGLNGEPFWFEFDKSYFSPIPGKDYYETFQTTGYLPIEVTLPDLSSVRGSYKIGVKNCDGSITTDHISKFSDLVKLVKVSDNDTPSGKILVFGTGREIPNGPNFKDLFYQSWDNYFGGVDPYDGLSPKGFVVCKARRKGNARLLEHLTESMHFGTKCCDGSITYKYYD